MKGWIFLSTLARCFERKRQAGAFFKPEDLYAE
jgi:hypothetical protein